MKVILTEVTDLLGAKVWEMHDSYGQLLTKWFIYPTQSDLQAFAAMYLGGIKIEITEKG